MHGKGLTIIDKVNLTKSSTKNSMYLRNFVQKYGSFH